MSPLDFFKLLLLGAIWGASFLFLRVASPEFGPILLIWLRVTGAALALSPFFLGRRHRQLLVRNSGKLTLLGLSNAAFPFTLLAIAALQLESGFSALLNASTPIFAALIGFLWLRAPLSAMQILGLLVGLLGVAILVGDRFSFAEDGPTSWAICATLVATASYGFSAQFTKRFFSDVPPMICASGGLIAASILLLPLVFFTLPREIPSPTAIGCAITLSLLSTAFAFVLIFDILSRCGATATTTVTFIIPIFGVIFGATFLGEQVTGRMILGMIVALLGAALVTKILRFRPKSKTVLEPETGD